MTTQLVFGRDRSADVVIDAPSVSSRHARLSWRGEELVLEDLGSANGTWVAGRRVERAIVKRGEDVRFADVALPWGAPEVVALLKLQSGKSTIAALPRFGRYVCPTCRSVQILPPGFVRGEIACPKCAAALEIGGKAPSLAWRAARGAVALTLSAAAALVVGVALVAVIAPERLANAPDPIGAFARDHLGAPLASVAVGEAQGGGDAAPALPAEPAAASPEEAAVRALAASAIRDAIDPSSPITRNLAVRVAAGDDGPFKVEQIARIWKHVRLAWRYVNDPRGTDYYARASETITNGFAGDCDDFAILLAAMIEAIGGRTRVVVMDGPGGGHAYTEVCIDGPPNEVSNKIARFYRQSWDRRLGARPPQLLIHYRSDASCPVWLNLDWTTNVIGGPYAEERYAIAIYADGTTETLAPFRSLEGAETNETSLPQRAPLER